MDIAEGFLFLIILFELVIGVIGTVFLAGTYSLLRRSENHILRCAIPALGMGLNFILFMQVDASLLIAGALSFPVFGSCRNCTMQK